MKQMFRCNCPVTSALDVIGDKWTLVILKQMLLDHKKTFKDFVESEEGIATNILSSRLKLLEKFRLVTKEKLPGNKKTNIYRLTERGLGLTPVIIELTMWSFVNLSEFNAGLFPDKRLEYLKRDKEGVIRMLLDNYKEKTGIMATSS